ncbi:MAG TPA: hypothetical protein VJZ71_06810 [Phycisphaerae bacterium]|nr:hypothetical protein [Phycisphaerae bacterium]
MSLKAFHVFFVAVCLVLLLGCGWWGLRDYRAGGGVESLYLGAGSLVAAFALGVYGAWFLRKLRNVSYV